MAVLFLAMMWLHVAGAQGREDVTSSLMNTHPSSTPTTIADHGTILLRTGTTWVSSSSSFRTATGGNSITNGLSTATPSSSYPSPSDAEAESAEDTNSGLIIGLSVGIPLVAFLKLGCFFTGRCLGRRKQIQKQRHDRERGSGPERQIGDDDGAESPTELQPGGLIDAGGKQRTPPTELQSTGPYEAEGECHRDARLATRSVELGG